MRIQREDVAIEHLRSAFRSGHAGEVATACHPSLAADCSRERRGDTLCTAHREGRQFAQSERVESVRACTRKFLRESGFSREQGQEEERKDESERLRCAGEALRSVVHGIRGCSINSGIRFGRRFLLSCFRGRSVWREAESLFRFRCNVQRRRWLPVLSSFVLPLRRSCFGTARGSFRGPAR